MVLIVAACIVLWFCSFGKAYGPYSVLGLAVNSDLDIPVFLEGSHKLEPGNAIYNVCSDEPCMLIIFMSNNFMCYAVCRFSRVYIIIID